MDTQDKNRQVSGQKLVPDNPHIKKNSNKKSKEEKHCATVDSSSVDTYINAIIVLGEIADFWARNLYNEFLHKLGHFYLTDIKGNPTEFKDKAQKICEQALKVFKAYRGATLDDSYSVSVCFKTYAYHANSGKDAKYFVEFAAPYAIATDRTPPGSSPLWQENTDNNQPHGGLSFSQRYIEKRDLKRGTKIMSDNYSDYVNENRYFTLRRTGQKGRGLIELFKCNKDWNPKDDELATKRNELLVVPIECGKNRIGYIQVVAYDNSTIFSTAEKDKFNSKDNNIIKFFKACASFLLLGDKFDNFDSIKIHENDSADSSIETSRTVFTNSEKKLFCEEIKKVYTDYNSQKLKDGSKITVKFTPMEKTLNP